MGATNIHYEHVAVDKSGDITAKQAFNNLYERAVWENGHDPYSGTIATCELGKSMIAPETEDEYDDLLERIDKREVRYYKKDDIWVFIGWAAC